MKLLLKFNLVFLIVFIFGLGASSYVARDLLKRQAEEVVVDRARLLMASPRQFPTSAPHRSPPCCKRK